MFALILYCLWLRQLSFWTFYACTLPDGHRLQYHINWSHLVTLPHFEFVYRRWANMAIEYMVIWKKHAQLLKIHGQTRTFSHLWSWRFFFFFFSYRIWTCIQTNVCYSSSEIREGCLCHCELLMINCYCNTIYIVLEAFDTSIIHQLHLNNNLTSSRSFCHSKIIFVVKKQ